jgi:Rieske Fe-S protein
MDRRVFLGTCAASCVAGAMPQHAQARLRPREYRRTLLVDASGVPLKATSLVAEQNYVFHYPYAGTPCFLLNLGRPVAPVAALKTAAAVSYAWPGGVGPGRSIVAYSAICAHKMTYPTRDISFISYRSKAGAQGSLERVIHCCSEHSQYDPARGAMVLAGPAPQPLAAILLDYDASKDTLHAIGTVGGEMFNQFFERFGFRLALEQGSGSPDQASGDRARVIELDSYCRQQVRC